MATQKQKFVDEQVRPLVEIMEAVAVRIATMKESRILQDPAIATGPYDDGRPNDSLDQFTEDTLNTLMDGFEAFHTDTLIPAASLLRSVAVRTPIG